MAPDILNPFLPRAAFWEVRLNEVAKALEKNDAKVSIVQSLAEARDLVLERCIPELGVKTAAFGGSMTVIESGLYASVKADKRLAVIDTNDPAISREDLMERRRGALTVDLFISSSNAVTRDGKLVNLDGMGNRTASIQFGPRHVILLISRNKICDNLDDAVHRVKSIAAPMNAMRYQLPTPCAKTGVCLDCNSPARVCRVWSVTEKVFPVGRIHVILINAESGF